VYSARNGTLSANTTGTGKYSYYVVDRIFSHSFHASLEWAAQVVQNEGQAVVISVASGPYAWNFNLAPHGVEVEQEGGWILAAPLDTRDGYHAYRVEIPARGSAFQLYVDDVLRYTGRAKEGGQNSAALVWGDVSSKDDSKVSWQYIKMAHRRPSTRVMPRLVAGAVSLSDQTKATRLGSTIPLKFQLFNDVGTNVSSPDLVVELVDLVWISPDAPGSVVDVESGPVESNFRYDSTVGDTGGYICNFNTRGLPSGTYNIILNVNGDPTPFKLQFQIR